MLVLKDVRWTDPDTLLECRVAKNGFSIPGGTKYEGIREWWCGYVRVPKGCPEIDDSLVDAPGGITCPQGDDRWVGFDCNHAWDRPGTMPGSRRTPWTEEKVKAEVTRLAAQIANIAGDIVILQDAVRR